MIGAGVVYVHHRSHFDPHTAWDGFTLPGFDAHVYVAMAEEPRVFTVAPWGYRILLPELIGTFLPPRFIVPGFEWAARISLVVAAGLLFAYLRLVGATLRAALVVMTLAMLTPPVRAVFENPFLVEPFALCLLLLSLIAIQGRASSWFVALALVLLSLSKEIWVFLLPLVFVRHLEDEDCRSAFRKTLLTATPALWVQIAMRFIWRSQATQTGDASLLPDLATSIGIVANHIGTWSLDYAIGGLALLAVVALKREAARDYLQEVIFTLLPLLALPLYAAAYTGDGVATSFFAGDVRRLLIYLIPFAAALATHLDRDHGPARELPASRVKVRRAALALVLAFLVAPASLIRYSRVDLSTSRDGPYVLGFVRETRRTARLLERGQAVIFDPAERRFAWGVSPPNELSRLRFFLRDGFGPLAHYGIHDIRTRGAVATLLVPLVAARPVSLTLTVDARETGWITLHAAGTKVGEVLVGPQAVKVSVTLPQEALFPGDNSIELRLSSPTIGVRILRIELRQAAA